MQWYGLAAEALLPSWYSERGPAPGPDVLPPTARST